MTGSSPANGDFLDFGLIAAAGDAGYRKKLLIGAAAAGFNGGRSKITIAPDGGFRAVGVSTAPTLIDWITSSSTLNTFVSSGAFTSRFSSFTHMDADGVQLSGTGPYALAASTFDYAGGGIASTSTLFTLNGVTPSTINVVGVTFGNNGTAGAKYNYTVAGSSVGLRWANYNYDGSLAGDLNERNDTSSKISWDGIYCSTLTSIHSGGWNQPETWDYGVIPSSCKSVVIAAGHTVVLDADLNYASSTTLNGTLNFSTVVPSTLTILSGSLTVNSWAACSRV